MNDLTENLLAPELEGLASAARDSVSDDMIARLTEAAAQAIDLLDRVNRSGVAEALPAIAEMVRTGDLQRMTHYARVLGAAEDAVTDDMLARIATLAGEATMVVDALHRSGVMKLIDLLDQLNTSGQLDRMAQRLPSHLETMDSMFLCLAEASKEAKALPAPSGGILPMLRMMSDPENQKALQFLMAVGRRMRASCTQA